MEKINNDHEYLEQISAYAVELLSIGKPKEEVKYKLLETGLDEKNIDIIISAAEKYIKEYDRYAKDGKQSIANKIILRGIGYTVIAVFISLMVYLFNLHNIFHIGALYPGILGIQKISKGIFRGYFD